LPLCAFAMGTLTLPESNRFYEAIRLPAQVIPAQEAMKIIAN
jgi:hypothetical protein